MTLQDYILSYEKDGQIVCNLFDYYRDFVQPLDERFKRYDLYQNKTVLCWFKDHEDVNPSMGYINDRHHKGGKVYHCFGCGRTGTVVRLHQILQSQYFNRSLTEEETCKELAMHFGIPLDEFDETAEDDVEAQYIDRMKRIDRVSKLYTSKDYAQNLLEIRKKGNINLADVNAECIKMIASSKYLNNPQ
jgi:DNA primase